MQHWWYTTNWILLTKLIPFLRCRCRRRSCVRSLIKDKGSAHHCSGSGEVKRLLSPCVCNLIVNWEACKLNFCVIFLFTFGWRTGIICTTTRAWLGKEEKKALPELHYVFEVAAAQTFGLVYSSVSVRLLMNWCSQLSARCTKRTAIRPGFETVS